MALPLPPLPPDMIVTFNYVDWITLYPEFANVTQVMAQQYFYMACGYCDNTPSSFAADDPDQLTYLLYLLTAHITKLFATIQAPGGGATQTPSGIVGQVTSASEGSVSIGTAALSPSGDMGAWLGQTPYGLAYWAATLKYRTGFWMARNRYAPQGNNLLAAIRNAAGYKRWPWYR